MDNELNAPKSNPSVLLAGAARLSPEPVQRELEKAGIQLKMVETTEDLLREASEETDAILLHESLMDNEGHLALELLKADSQRFEIPVLIISDQKGSRERFLKAGAHDVLFQPISWMDLSLKISAIARFKCYLHRSIRPWAYARAIEFETRQRLLGESAFESRWGFMRTPEGLMPQPRVNFLT